MMLKIKSLLPSFWYYLLLISVNGIFL